MVATKLSSLTSKAAAAGSASSGESPTARQKSSNSTSVSTAGSPSRTQVNTETTAVANKNNKNDDSAGMFSFFSTTSNENTNSNSYTEKSEDSGVWERYTSQFYGMLDSSVKTVTWALTPQQTSSEEEKHSDRGLDQPLQPTTPKRSVTSESTSVPSPSSAKQTLLKKLPNPLPLSNPYSTTSRQGTTSYALRGRVSDASVLTVRSMISMMPDNDPDVDQKHQQSSMDQPPPPPPFCTDGREGTGDVNEQKVMAHALESTGKQSVTSGSSTTDGSAAQTQPQYSHSYTRQGSSSLHVSDAETASRLAEGTIRALRDLTMDESVRLNAWLQFWTERWERPFLSWLEAGPNVWFSPGGYKHQLVGQKVSQLQAVLARRCVSVGELQQHLWRAGWQKGVAQWGVLGQGGQRWAAVVGGDGTLLDETTRYSQSARATLEVFPERPIDGSFLGDGGGVQDTTKLRSSASSSAEDDPTLAAWSVDAMKIVRDQLYRARGDHDRLPFYENWKREERFFHGECFAVDDARADYLPLWATEDVEERSGSGVGMVGYNRGATGDKPFKRGDSGDALDGAFGSGSSIDSDRGAVKFRISDVNLMAAEVTELLNIMELGVGEQRTRRHEQLRPPSRLVRNWYIVAAGVPLAAYMAVKIVRDRWGLQLLRQICSNVSAFYSEHVSDPVTYVYTHVFTNFVREEVADQMARMSAIVSLKKMLMSWMEETFPEMNQTDRIKLAESMDMSLLEKKKEDSVKHALYEISDIVRMSLIEMQFIKKELMNAMAAMDELMQSNEFNFKLAAMTPAVLIMFGAAKFFRFLRYALLKLGKSREQTHESLRLIILDIERLLVMRDCPPAAPPAPAWEESYQRSEDRTIEQSLSHVSAQTETTQGANSRREPKREREIAVESERNVLKSNDLGMLLLLIHECHTIMLNNKRRFSRQDVRSMSEDLAELSGERGPVSVKQQLLIVSRMFRTYPFLKVVSSGGFIDFKRYI